ncbi:hypothetical protein PAMA_013592 [Pampus argenteus]
MNRNTVDTVEAFSKMSKAELLTRFVTERLAAASREILAVVERTVAGYEEEASGFRQEIDRQRRQLEVLLQPQVKLNKAGVKHSRRPEEGEEEEEEGEEGEEEEEEDNESPHLYNNQTPTRSLCCRRPSDRKKPGRLQISETQNHVGLRIRILDDSQADVLSNNVLKKCPMLKLQCPLGLQEADFLQLLRSSFPQLAGEDKPFDVFTCDKRRRLQRLKLKTLTAEEIQRNISCSGWKSTLYIRLKAGKENNSCEESLCTSAMLSCDDDQTSPVHEVEGSSSTSQEGVNMETDEADAENHRISEQPEGLAAAQRTVNVDDDGEREEEAMDSVGDYKPDGEEPDSDLLEKKQKNRRSGVKKTGTENSDAVLSCKVCRVLHKSLVTLVKHVWSHVDDPRSVCGVCGETTETLKDHLQSRHKTDDCHVCGESFLDALSLNEHVAAHSGERPYRCDVCREAFALKVSLEIHQRQHETGKLHKCYTCHKVFDLKEQLKAHRSSHSNKKAHLCGVCGKSLSDYRSLSRHKMTHSGERPHTCQVCGRRFKLLGTLRQHEKIHTERERSYLCDVCCKMFLTSKQLQIHMRTHTNEKPYHCGECGRGFTTKGPLTIHMRIHTGEAPYICPDCGWSFKRKINLDNHVTVHSGLKPFVCGICGKACARKTYLTVHMRTHNGERPYKCSLCEKAFTQSHCLKTHMKSHQGDEAAA